MTDAQITVALCDDHRIVRSGLRRLIEEAADIHVVGEAGTAEEAAAIAASEAPDVFVMDLGLPGVSGFEATAMVLDASPSTKVLVLTAHDDIAYLRKAFRAGAKGYLVKDIADLELVLAIRQLAAGREYVDPTLGAALLAPESPGPLPMPLQFLLSGPIGQAAQESGHEAFVGSPAGQVVGTIHEIKPCREIVFDMVSEARDVFDSLAGVPA